ncbi:MAG: glycosyltransferase family 4 protein [Planctomycetota bacterium]|jgi:glycosyltransferase involved in cell wall biosynthesis|nr:glycosyltransferase family 4 protein [Planctomycetota bacterium]
MPKIAIASNTAWSLVNFRLNLARALQVAGHEVIAIAPPGKESKQLESAGIKFIALPMDNKGANPIADLWLFLRLRRVLRKERPAVYLGYTVKPNVYGGMACQQLGIPSIHNIAGLGTVFIRNSWLTKLVRGLYRCGLRKAARVFFQNPDDLKLFTQHKTVSLKQAKLLPGSGVDTSWFVPKKNLGKKSPPQFKFLLSARVLWDKGIGEYAQAARCLLGEGRKVECQLLGFLDVQNRSAIPLEVISNWEQEGIIRYLGCADDVRAILAQADCVVLPSYYREGVPRSLLEAASMGKPLITTDAVGCREAVADGATGFICKPKSAVDLADKMRRMMDLPHDTRATMGRRGREKMKAEFEEKIVIEAYLQEVNLL